MKNNLNKQISFLNVVASVVFLAVMTVLRYVAGEEVRFWTAIAVAVICIACLIVEIVQFNKKRYTPPSTLRALAAATVIALGGAGDILWDMSLPGILSLLISAAILFVPSVIEHTAKNTEIDHKSRLNQKMTVLNWAVFAILMLVLDITYFAKASDDVRAAAIITCFVISMIIMVAEIIISTKNQLHSFLTQYIVGSVMILAVGHSMCSFMELLDISSAVHLLPVVLVGLYLLCGRTAKNPPEITKKTYLRRCILFLSILAIVGAFVFTWTPNHEVYNQQILQRSDSVDDETDYLALLTEAQEQAAGGKLVDYRLYCVYENGALKKEGIRFVFNIGKTQYVSICFLGKEEKIERGRLRTLSENEVLFDESVEHVIDEVFREELNDFAEHAVDWKKEYGMHIMFNLKAAGSRQTNSVVYSVEFGPQIGVSSMQSYRAT